MRLSAADRHAIESSAREAFPPGTRAVLFGSRIDDTRRGGDIDLLTEPVCALAADDLVARRSRFVARLCRLLDEQRIDVVVACTSAGEESPAVQTARRDGIELALT